MISKSRVYVLFLCILGFGVLPIFSCGARNSISVHPAVMHVGGVAHVVSFVDDVQFTLERIGRYKEINQRDLMEEVKKAQAKALKEQAKYVDLKELKTYKKDYTKPHDEILLSLKPNDAIMNSFIVEFRKRQSKFKLKSNIKLSQQKVSRRGKERRKDFEKYKSYLSKAKLVFDLRINDIKISQYKPSDDPDTSSGFFSTWAVYVNAKGYLYDLKTGRVLWRSNAIESWSDTSIILYTGLFKGQGEPLMRAFARVINNAGQRLAISFFRG